MFITLFSLWLPSKYHCVIKLVWVVLILQPFPFCSLSIRKKPNFNFFSCFLLIFKLQTFLNQKVCFLEQLTWYISCQLHKNSIFIVLTTHKKRRDLQFTSAKIYLMSTHRIFFVMPLECERKSMKFESEMRYISTSIRGDHKRLIASIGSSISLYSCFKSQQTHHQKMQSICMTFQSQISETHACTPEASQKKFCQFIWNRSKIGFV